MVLDTAVPAGTGVTDPTLAFGLTAVSDWSTEMPFLDITKTMRAFAGEGLTAADNLSSAALEAGGYLDAAGWPVEIPAGMRSVRTSWDWSGSKTDAGAAASRAGVYVLTYEGEGTLKLTGDAKVLSSEPGRIVFQNTSGGSMTMSITATDPRHNGDYLHDVAIVPQKYEALHAAGELFNPDWLSVVQDAHTLRFMDWMDTNGSTQAAWTDRSHVGDATWAGEGGVPLEVMVELANQTGTEPWFNIPVGANADYITRFATYVRDHLDPAIKVHVEFANEAWNSGLPTYHALDKMSVAAWGVHAAFDYHAKLATQTAVIWDRVFGSAAEARVDNVLGTQTQNDWIGNRYLTAPNWQKYEPGSYVSPASVFDSLAVTSYFGGGNIIDPDLRAELLAVIRDPGVDAAAWLKARLLDPAYRGSIPQVETAWAANKATADKYGLDLVAYEGGQHVLHSFGIKGISAADLDTLTDFLSGFVRSPAMADLYDKLWQAWSEISDGPFMQYGDVSAASKYGAWGIFTSLGDHNPRADLLTDLNATSEAWFGDGGGSRYQQGVIRVAGDGGETLTGTDKDDFLIGGRGRDTLVAGRGHDAIDGGAGRDTLVLAGRAEDYKLAASGDTYHLTATNTDHTIKNIETFQFAEGTERELEAMLRN